MKTIILSGGLGSRLGEYTENIPKPMIPIGGKPLLWHIMQRFAMFGHTDFGIALGYKAHVIKDYFLNYATNSNDFSIDLASGKINILNPIEDNWNISLFHYRNLGAAFAKVLIGIQDNPKSSKRLEAHLKGLEYNFVEETTNNAYQDFLR